jgi:hypothetical protein
LVGGGTWFFTLREECRLRDLENKVLRISGPKTKEEMGDWRRMQNE